MNKTPLLALADQCDDLITEIQETPDHYLADYLEEIQNRARNLRDRAARYPHSADQARRGDTVSLLHLGHEETIAVRRTYEYDGVVYLTDHTGHTWPLHLNDTRHTIRIH